MSYGYERSCSSARRVSNFNSNVFQGGIYLYIKLHCNVLGIDNVMRTDRYAHIHTYTDSLNSIVSQPRRDSQLNMQQQQNNQIYQPVCLINQHLNLKVSYSILWRDRLFFRGHNVVRVVITSHQTDHWNQELLSTRYDIAFWRNLQLYHVVVHYVCSINLCVMNRNNNRNIDLEMLLFLTTFEYNVCVPVLCHKFPFTNYIPLICSVTLRARKYPYIFIKIN